MKWNDEHTERFAYQVDRYNKMGYGNQQAMLYALDHCNFELYLQAYDLGSTPDAIRKVIFNAMER